MYGKIFSSTFTGSMLGAGADVFAVWSYVIANTVAGTVELNEDYLAIVLGMKPEAVVAVLEKLQAPDPRSRNKDFEGCRLIREGQFQYCVPSHDTYRELRSEDARREYQRNWIKNKRSKENRGLNDRVDIDESRHGIDESTPASVSASGSGSASEISDPDQSKPGAKAVPWRAEDWGRRFGAAWAAGRGRLAYGRGSDRDAKARGELQAILDSLPTDQQAKAQVAAPEMFEAFLASDGFRQKTGHPFWLFVQEFVQVHSEAIGASGSEVPVTGQYVHREGPRQQVTRDAKI